MTKATKRWALLSATAAVALSTLPTYAALKKWDGGSSTGEWTTAGNWDGSASGSVPVNGDSVLLDNSLLATLPSSMTTTGFTRTLTSITINSANTLTLGNAGNGSTSSKITLSGAGDTGNTLLSNVGSGNFTIQPQTSGNKNLTLELSASGTFNVSGAGNLNITADISESAAGKGITKSGSGLLILGGSNSFTGATTINDGTLRLTSGSALADSVAVSLADVAAATLNIASSETIGSLAGGGSTGGNVTLNSGVTLTAGGNNTSTIYSGAISGATGNLTKTGSGTFTLAGNNNTYGGTTTVSGGTLSVTNSLSNAAIVVNGGNLSVGGSATGNVSISSGSITGGTYMPATLARTGGSITGGTFTVSGDYTNSGFSTGNTFAAKGGTSGVSAGVTVNHAGTSDQSVTGSVTNGATATPSIDFGNVRAGVNSTKSFAIAYGGDVTGPTLRGALQTANLFGSPFSITGVTSTSGGSYTLANGASASQTLNFNSTGGSFNKTFGLVNNFDDVRDQTVTVTGAAYRLATASNTSAAFGNVRQGSTQSTNVTITNTASADGFSDDLQSNLGTITGAGITASGGPVTLAAGNANTAGSMTVGIDTSTAGSRSGSVAINHLSVPTVSGLSSQSLANGSVSVSGSVYRYASTNFAGTTVNFGNVRQGAGVSSQNISVTNTAATDGFSDNLGAAFGTPSVSGITTSNTLLSTGITPGTTVSGGPNKLQVGISTASAGTRTGTVALGFTSVPTVAGLDGGHSVGNQTINVTGGVYRYAAAQLNTTSLNLGIVHVGDTVNGDVTVTNTASTDGFSDNLGASFGTLTGTNMSRSGGPVSVGAGASNASGSLIVSLNTTTAGTRSGSVPVNFVSNPTVTGPDTGHSLGSSTVTISGQVNNYAAASFAKTSGDGTLTTGGPTSYTLDLGSINENSGTLAQNLSLSNIGGSLSFTDLLSGAYDVSGAGAFNLTGFSSFSLGGGANQGLAVALDSILAPNTYTGTITLTPHSTNGSGYDGTLSQITLNLSGTVVAVPEPTMVGLIGVVSSVGLLARRRRRAAC